MLDTAKSNRARKKETNEKSLYKIRVENQRAHLPLQDCPADKINWNKVFPVNTTNTPGRRQLPGSRNSQIIPENN